MGKNSEVNIKKKYVLEFWAFKICIAFFKMLPYSFSVQLLIFISRLIKFRKIVAYKNLKKVFSNLPERKLKEILNKCYENYAKNIAEIYLADNQKLFNKIKTKGWYNLEEALSKGKGVILASAHIGNWELAGSYIASKKKMGVIIKKQKNPLFNDYMIKTREKENMKIIYTKNALRDIIKYLKENYIITILIDQSAGKSGIKTNFLSLPASTFVGPAKISLKTKSPIVPAFAIRNNDNTHTFYFEKPIYTEDIQNTVENVKNITNQLNNILEKYILKYPDQWFWVHKRWKGAKKAKAI